MKKKIRYVFFLYLPVAGRNEKKNYTHVFRYFSNSMCEKKKMYLCIFGHFPVAGNK